MEDEKWLKQIKKRLDDYSEPLPQEGWERIERELETPVLQPRQTWMLRSWGRMAAAAVLLLAISTISLWLLQSPVGEEMRQMPPIALQPDELPLPTMPDRTRPEEKRLAVQQIRPATPHTSPELLPKEPMQPVPTTDDIHLDAEEDIPAETVSSASQPTTQSVTEERKPQYKYKPSNKSKLHLPDSRQKEKRRKKWSIGVSMGNGTLSNSSLPEREDFMEDFMSDPVFPAEQPPFYQTGIVVSKDMELIYLNGLPYLQERKHGIESIHHKQPLSFGLSVRKELRSRFSVETGVTYTYLASDIQWKGEKEQDTQKLHYIGIPLRANWHFVENPKVQLYLSAGGSIEKCVSAKIGSEHTSIHPLQLSVMGAVGAQYNLSNHTGIYIEPGLSYYFDDGSDVQTIRKENPCNFTLQAGIRLTY